MPHQKQLEVIAQSVPLQEADIKLIEKHFEPVAVNKNTILEAEGKITGHLYFINEGFVKLFQMEDGTEVTTHILGSSNFITSFNSFTSRTPSTENVKTITACQLLRITKKDLDTLYLCSEKWVAFCKKVYENAITFCEQRAKEFQTLPAEKRYQKLLTNHPDIIQHVPVQDIASYIGVKPESLSRIRRQLIS